MKNWARNWWICHIFLFEPQTLRPNFEIFGKMCPQWKEDCNVQSHVVICCRRISFHFKPYGVLCATCCLLPWHHHVELEKVWNPLHLNGTADWFLTDTMYLWQFKCKLLTTVTKLTWYGVLHCSKIHRFLQLKTIW